MIAEGTEPPDVEPETEDAEAALDPELDAGEELGPPGEPSGDAGPEPAPSGEPGPGRALSDEQLASAVAALLFASPDPLGTARLVALLEGPEPARVEAAVEEVGRRLESANLPIEPRRIAGGWQLLTRPEASAAVARLAKVRREERVSPAALETLAVIAYRQPVTKAEVEAIRGVQVGPVLRTLVDRGLVRVAGRADVPGHPLLYGTSKRFLTAFGLGSLADLPRDAELLKD